MENPHFSPHNFSKRFLSTQNMIFCKLWVSRTVWGLSQPWKLCIYDICRISLIVMYSTVAQDHGTRFTILLAICVCDCTMAIFGILPVITNEPTIIYVRRISAAPLLNNTTILPTSNQFCFLLTLCTKQISIYVTMCVRVWTTQKIPFDQILTDLTCQSISNPPTD